MTIVAAQNQPEQVTTAFKRNVFGLVTEIKRSDSYQGSPTSVTRNYTFDSAMRFCKSIDPESGATVFNYDNANNLAWSASGQALPDTTPSACERASVPASAKAVHSYNARNQRIWASPCGCNTATK